MMSSDENKDRLGSGQTSLAKPSSYIVRYSKFEEEQEEYQECPKRLEDDLGIIRMRPGQTLNFHLCSRKCPANDVMTDDVIKKDTFCNDETDQERCVELLRKRIRDVFEDIHKELKTGKNRGSRPQSTNVIRQRNPEQERPCTSNEVNALFRDRRLTQRDSIALKQFMEGILRKKIKKKGWKREGSAALSYDVTERMTSSRSQRRPPTRQTDTTNKTKVTYDGMLSERYLDLWKEKLKESARRVVSARRGEDVISAGDRSDAINDNKTKNPQNREEPRPRLKLFALGRSSRGSTADWVMKQNFDKFTPEESDSYVTKNKLKNNK